MKFEWIEKSDDKDYVLAEDINYIANYLIANEGNEIVNIGKVSRLWHKLLVYDKYGKPTKKTSDVHAGVFRFEIEDSSGDDEQIIKCILIQTINSFIDKGNPENDSFYVYQLVIYGYGRQIFRTIENINDTTYPIFEDYKVTPYNGELDEFAPDDQPLSAEKGYVLNQGIAENKNKLLEKESILNKVTDINYNINNSSYPTTKAVKDYVDANKVEVNVLKGSASGTPVVLYDVSPIVHDITATEDIGATAIVRCGKNQFNGELVSGAWLYGDGKYSPNSSGYVTCAEKIPILGGKQYTLSFTANKGNMNGVVFYDLDGKFISGDSTIRANPYTFTAPDEAAYVCFNLYSSGLTVEDIEKVLLEFGSTKTEYEPYVEPIEYPSDQEPIKIPSLYPTTVLYERGGYGFVTAEYNRDINKVIANLENALLTLGGNV